MSTGPLIVNVSAENGLPNHLGVCRFKCKWATETVNSSHAHGSLQASVMCVNNLHQYSCFCSSCERIIVIDSFVTSQKERKY